MGTPTTNLTNAEVADLNRVKLRLRTAGVNLDGLKWHIVAVHWRPIGFDFMCGDYPKGQHQADISARMAHDYIDMPGYDAWRAAEELRHGTVHINETTNYWDQLAPFGGAKKSGAGRELAGWILDALTEILT